ncbi:ribosomal protein S18-alanine N-acetyltransferase [uncultured Thiothrix sp.]|uniref:ribosomal protein S18-alanine N-acetyltransferase n=1 Tax=uncultured Thiothrix sp. TaxID=223185 RepID=UPI00261BBE77|nr:ribosomal protein S18-alanine N-acetyltransferase [uncultured Thiothrix sp.]HMT92803.1 ribosomal protein S18-alanine N-acetyltransferase [Thiolinea sp.]
MPEFSPFLPLRPMNLADLERIMPIEERAYPYPWTLGIFQDCLKHKTYHAYIYELDQQILAYCVLSIAVGELHILNITVEPCQQKRGLGRRLLATAEQIASGLGAQDCFLEVRPSNTAAIHLYLAQGFNEVGLRKNYYPAKNGREHALLMAKTLV